MKTRIAIGVVLLVIGILAAMPRSKPQPTPAPQPGGFSLRGRFIGPTAPADAATLSALCDELADIIEQDGMRDEPRLRSGLAFDELRHIAREARCRGESIGQRQPHAREAIAAYLEEQLGKSGGPVGPQQRAKWVSAYRELGRACGDAAR